MFEREFELTLAYSEGADNKSTVHVLTFSDPTEIDDWDVANCGMALGRWKAFDLRGDGPIQSIALCKTCFSEPVMKPWLAN